MKYDAIIVGAGPAGGQCARELAEFGLKVLLLEKAKDFSVNNFSSGGSPIEIMQEFGLPDSLIGTTWNKFALYSSSTRHIWDSKDALGVVFEFQRLRAFLSQEMEKRGGELQLNTAYQNHEQKDGHTVVWIKKKETSGLIPLETKVLVDATGAESEVLKNHDNSQKRMTAIGIEYFVKVPPQDYETYAHCLSFYMGSKWMPQGYSWIFPMEENMLKVGIGRYFANEHFVPYLNSYRHYLDHMLSECLSKHEILDKHGKTLQYTYGRKDVHYKENIIVIGDAVSTLNPFGCEGIRHAMKSGHFAAKAIAEYIQGNKEAFKHYVKTMNSYFGWKWRMSEMFMDHIYKEPKDKNIDLLVKAFSGLTTSEMMDLGFNYSFKPGLKFGLRYFGYRLFA